MYKRQDQIIDGALEQDDPLEVFAKIEKIFEKNNLPLFAKIYKCFETDVYKRQILLLMVVRD